MSKIWEIEKIYNTIWEDWRVSECWVSYFPRSATHLQITVVLEYTIWYKDLLIVQNMHKGVMDEIILKCTLRKSKVFAPETIQKSTPCIVFIVSILNIIDCHVLDCKSRIVKPCNNCISGINIFELGISKGWIGVQMCMDIGLRIQPYILIVLS